MHLGVLATAWHAFTTKTIFTVYYKPRTSPAEFIVPFGQYMESLKNNCSIGMRFKMRFEGEEAPEQRFTGTVVGIEDADPKRWQDSKWRCLESDTAEKSVMWPPSVDDKNNDVVSASRKFASENWMSSGRHERTCTDLLSGFGSNAESLHGYCSSLVDQTLVAGNSTRKQLLYFTWEWIFKSYILHGYDLSPYFI